MTPEQYSARATKVLSLHEEFCAEITAQTSYSFMSLEQGLSRIFRHDANSCLLCHEELFWWRHSCEPEMLNMNMDAETYLNNLWELRQQALDKPTLLTWRQYI